MELLQCFEFDVDFLSFSYPHKSQNSFELPLNPKKKKKKKFTKNIFLVFYIINPVNVTLSIYFRKFYMKN